MRYLPSAVNSTISYLLASHRLPFRAIQRAFRETPIQELWVLVEEQDEVGLQQVAFSDILGVDGGIAYRNICWLTKRRLEICEIGVIFYADGEDCGLHQSTPFLAALATEVAVSLNCWKSDRSLS
jgi:hypothetical protein